MKPVFHTARISAANSFLILLILFAAARVSAATLVVTTSADGGLGSLRTTIALANSGDTITFSSALSNQVIHLTNGELVISNNLTIDASALSGGMVIDAGRNSRVLLIAGGNVGLNYLTFTNGFVSDFGGGIAVGRGASATLNQCSICSNSSSSIGGGLCNGGPVTLNACTLSFNQAVLGGGILDSNSITLNNCTLSGNFSSSAGGAIYASYSETLNNCTISSNSAGSIGGICKVVSLPLRLTNTIVAGNSSGDLALGPDTSVNSLVGYPIPRLAPLGNYGGPTQTMPPLFPSPVIDGGTNSVTNFLSTDQRGFPRLSGAHVDIGAVEAQIAPANNPPVLRNAIRLSRGGANSFQFTFTNVANADFTALTSTNAALPLEEWTTLGNATQTSPGYYQFTDTSATNTAQFYLLVSP